MLFSANYGIIPDSMDLHYPEDKPDIKANINRMTRQKT